MNKIGIFTGFFLPHLGGIERYTSNLSDELIKRGYEIKIITTNHDNIDIEFINNMEMFRFPTYKLFKQRYPLIKIDKNYTNIVRKLKSEKFDYLICNTRFHLTTLVGLNLAKKANIPSLIIEHGSNHFSVDNKTKDFLGSIFEHFLTHITKKKTSNYYGVSERCNNWLKHFNIKANNIFYNSVDEKDYEKYSLVNKNKYKTNDNQIIITFASRIIKEKGIIMLLDSFLRLKKNHKNIVLIIAGDGPLLEEVKNKYNQKDIRFLGKISYDEIMTLFNETDILAHPSMYPEGLPTSILEAGLMKCAVVATDRGGTIEVIINDSYGLICEENENSLYEKLNILILNKKLRKDMAQKLHDRIIGNFTWKVTAAKVIDELKQIS